MSTQSNDNCTIRPVNEVRIGPQGQERIFLNKTERENILEKFPKLRQDEMNRTHGQQKQVSQAVTLNNRTPALLTRWRHPFQKETTDARTKSHVTLMLVNPTNGVMEIPPKGDHI